MEYRDIVTIWYTGHLTRYAIYHRCNCFKVLHIMQAKSHQPATGRSCCFQVALRFEPWSLRNIRREGTSLSQILKKNKQTTRSAEMTVHVLSADTKSHLVSASQICSCAFSQKVRSGFTFLLQKMRRNRRNKWTGWLNDTSQSSYLIRPLCNIIYSQCCWQE